MNRLKLINSLSLGFAITLVLVSVVVAYILVVPVTVLEHWKLTVQGGTYRPGDTVKAHIEADKVRSVKPFAHRSIECKQLNGSFVAYHLSDVKGINSQVGHISTNLAFVVPSNIPSLPSTCRFSITAQYQVYGFKTITEYTASNTFRVE